MARGKRAKGKRIEVTNREIGIEDKKWEVEKERWKKEEMKWEEKGESRGGGRGKR